jgi:hypothetical protein
MHTLFDPAIVSAVEQRIAALTPARAAAWGEMDVAAMLGHCAAGLEMARGTLIIPRTFLGRLLGPVFKSQFTGEGVFGKNSPTSPALKTPSGRNFDAEKQKLLTTLRAFAEAGEAGATRHPHPFFGPLTPAQWGVGMYKHLDHHLRQFGV